MPMMYVAAGNSGAATTTSATAGIVGIYNPASATMAGARIAEWTIGPASASADNTYAVRWRRNTTASTWTSITSVDTGPKATACISLAGNISTARGTLSAGNVGCFGFHMRGGWKEVYVPGGELGVPYTFSNGLELEFYFAGGTDTLAASVFFFE